MISDIARAGLLVTTTLLLYTLKTPTPIIILIATLTAIDTAITTARHLHLRKTHKKYRHLAEQRKRQAQSLLLFLPQTTQQDKNKSNNQTPKQDSNTKPRTKPDNSI